MRRGCLAGLMLLVGGCTARETVVVYSPHGPDVLREYESRFEAQYPGVDVQALDMGSQEVYNRVSSERNRPVGDVWWGGPSAMFIQAAKEGLLQPYRPQWAGAVDSANKDPGDLWYATYRSPLCIVFNTTKYGRDSVPQTWDELLDPKWNGKIVIRKPLASGTMRTFIGAMILRAGNEDAGIAWLKSLHSSTKTYLESPQLFYDHIKRNPEMIGIWLMPDVFMQRQLNGYPFDCVVPADAPMLIEGIGLIKNAPHVEWAKKFYEFVTTESALAHQAASYFKIPVRTDLDAAQLPSWFSELKLRPMNIDWNAFAQNENRWCERWEHEVFGQP